MHALALHAVDVPDRGLAGQVGVFAVALERPPPARVADDVHGRPQVHVGALAALLAADHGAVRAGQRRIPGRGERHRRRQLGHARHAVGHALRPVLQVQGRDAQRAGWPRCGRRSRPCRSRSRRRRPWRACRRGSSRRAPRLTRVAIGARGVHPRAACWLAAAPTVAAGPGGGAGPGGRPERRTGAGNGARGGGGAAAAAGRRRGGARARWGCAGGVRTHGSSSACGCCDTGHADRRTLRRKLEVSSISEIKVGNPDVNSFFISERSDRHYDRYLRWLLLRC